MRLSVSPILLAAIGLSLAACGGGVGTPADSGLGQFMRGTTNEPTTIREDVIAAAISCPGVRVQPQTEFIRREVEGAEGNTGLRWQASITQTARECRKAEDGTSVRVGVSGQVIEGPRGAGGTVELPLRIAVRERGEVTYSRLHSVTVTLAGASQTWAFVDEDVFVKDPDRADIVVGFDS